VCFILKNGHLFDKTLNHAKKRAHHVKKHSIHAKKRSIHFENKIYP